MPRRRKFLGKARIQGFAEEVKPAIQMFRAKIQGEVPAHHIERLVCLDTAAHGDPPKISDMMLMCEWVFDVRKEWSEHRVFMQALVEISYNHFNAFAPDFSA